MNRNRLLSWVALAPATLLATTVLATTVLAAPAALAGPPPAVTHTWQLPPGGYDAVAGLGSMWVARDDIFNKTAVYRIDPSTNAMAYVTTLPFPTGGFAVAYGSLWFTDYFGNALVRVSPNGTQLASIRVGLQPYWLTAAFGSMWTSNHHGGSISRIDPTTDTVVATLAVGAQHTFRNGPEAIAHDATRLYVGSSNLDNLQSIDPATETVSTSPASTGDAYCQPTYAVSGVLWSLDTSCSGSIYILGTDGTVLRSFDAAAGFAEWLTVLNGSPWLSVARSYDPGTALGSQSVLEQLDPATGVLLRTVRIGGDASRVASGYGDLWVTDFNRHTLRRVQV